MNARFPAPRAGARAAPNSPASSSRAAARLDPLLSLHWLASEAPARLGLAVSRKVDPHAVGRNRIKRVLRDQFRKLRAQLPGGDYVLVARVAARKRRQRAACATTFLRLLQRAGALPRTGRGRHNAAGHANRLPPLPLPFPRRAQSGRFRPAEPACLMNQTRMFLIFAWMMVATLLWMEWGKDNAPQARAGGDAERAGRPPRTSSASTVPGATAAGRQRRPAGSRPCPRPPQRAAGAAIRA